MTLSHYQPYRAIAGGHWAYSTSGHATGWHPITAKIYTRYNQPGMRPSWITHTERYDGAETMAARLTLALCVMAAVWVGVVAA